MRSVAYGPCNGLILLWLLEACVLLALVSAPASGQTVNASVNLSSQITQFPEYGLGIHTSVYDNLQHTGSTVDELLPDRLDGAGINVLRYPGGGYADIFHFSVSQYQWGGGLIGHGFTPWWGTEGNYGWMNPNNDFGNFVKLLDATNTKTVITLNSGGALKYDNPANPTKLVVPSHGGQPQEAAAWVAYANADADIFGTDDDIELGVDDEGNDWKTAGYWAKLRASANPAAYQQWAQNPDGDPMTNDSVYDPRNAFLAIGRVEPVGIEYWEVGNESFGTGYYGGGNGYALNYAVPYDGTNRDDNPALSPAAYGAQVNSYVAAMKAVDPSVKIGAVLATPRTSAFVSWNTIGDYFWSYADLDDDGIKDPDEPYWNDEVLAQNDPELGKVADNIDFVIAHWYPTPDNGANGIVHEPRLTIPPMIHGTTSGHDTGSNAGLRDTIATWRSDGDQNGLEIFITETDGYGGSNQSADGLYAADMYATFFENGVSNVDWLELHNGESFLTGANEPNFAYFGIQSVHLLAEPGDMLVSTTTSESDVRIHAAERSDGSVAVMVINMNTGSRTVNISIDGAELAEDGVRYQTNGDTALAMTNLSGLGDSFSTSIAARTLQLFIIPGLPGLEGDYNGNGAIDAADYTVWRDALSAGGSSLTNDPTPGVVDESDFIYWRDHFGETLGAGAGSGAGALAVPTVPEPASIWLTLVAFSMLSIRRVSFPATDAHCRTTTLY